MDTEPHAVAPYDVFISYSASDKDVANATCVTLESKGIRCWIAPRDILPGVEWVSAVQEGIKSSAVLVLLLSETANLSQWVRREVQQAIGANGIIIPLRLDESSLSGEMEFLLGTVHRLDALPPPAEQHFPKLIHAVTASLGRATVDSPPICVSSIGARENFWKPFATSALTIVFGRFLKEFSEFEASGLMGYGCAMALSQLREFLGTLGIINYSVCCADLLQRDLLRTNVVLLGGPYPNQLSQEFIDRVRPRLHFGSKEYQIAVEDSLEGRTYSPTLAISGSQVANDYAIIIRSANPFGGDGKVLFIAGSYGYGTWAGVKFVCSHEFCINDIVASGVPFECLVECDVINDTPVLLRPIFIRETI